VARLHLQGGGDIVDDRLAGEHRAKQILAALEKMGPDAPEFPPSARRTADQRARARQQRGSLRIPLPAPGCPGQRTARPGPRRQRCRGGRTPPIPTRASSPPPPTTSSDRCCPCSTAPKISSAAHSLKASGSTAGPAKSRRHSRRIRAATGISRVVGNARSAWCRGRSG
jgi:hypothetical protein